MKSCRNRHLERAQQGYDVAAGGATENSEFMLEGDRPDVSDIKKIRRPLIRREIVFLDFKADAIRVIIARIDVVDRDGKAMGLRVLRGKGFAKVGREGRDPAFAGQIVAYKSQFTNFRKV